MSTTARICNEGRTQLVILLPVFSPVSSPFFPSASCSLHTDEILTPQTPARLDVRLLSRSRHGILLFSQSIQTKLSRLNLLRTVGTHWPSFGVLTSRCRTASLCWDCRTRTAGPGGILLSWSSRLHPGPDPGTLTARCFSPWQSADAPLSSTEN